MLYKIELEEGFPAFYIASPGTDPDTGSPTMVFNDPDLFSFGFLIANIEANTTVAALPCTEVIPKYVKD